MLVIDNKGKVYNTIAEFAKLVNVPRTTISGVLHSKGSYTINDITIKPYVVGNVETQVDEEYENYKAVRGSDFKYYKIEPKNNDRGKRYAIALFSDAHIEETVESDSVLGLNSYDITIAEERIKAYFANLAVCLKRDAVDTLYFASLGDTISSFLHEHLMQENGMTPPEATIFGQSLIVSGLKHLRNELPNLHIVFIGISGNHSRITKKVQNSNGFKMSYEWIMYQNIKSICENADFDIEFLISESELALIETPDGKRYIFCHGYQVQSKGTGTVAGIYPALGRLAMKWQKIFKQDKIFLGHYHTCVSIPTATVNGSIIGYNAFALTNGMGFEEPAQMYEVFDSEIGQLLSRKIYCK